MFSVFGLYALLNISSAGEQGLSLRVAAMSAAQYASKRDSMRCIEWTDELVLCPLAVNNSKIEFSTFGDISDEVLKYKLKMDLEPRVTQERYAVYKTNSVDGAYWATGALDGFDAAGWLFPRKLEEIAGGPVLVAQPSRGMFCFWLKSDSSVHKNMAVGIKEAYQSSKDPVSSKVYHWDGRKWLVWGEAVATDTDSSPSKSSSNGQ